MNTTEKLWLDEEEDNSNPNISKQKYFDVNLAIIKSESGSITHIQVYLKKTCAHQSKGSHYTKYPDNHGQAQVIIEDKSINRFFWDINIAATKSKNSLTLPRHYVYINSRILASLPQSS